MEWRLCDIAFGPGRGPVSQSDRPRVGPPTSARWDVVDIGSFIWHDGALGRVRAKGHALGYLWLRLQATLRQRTRLSILSYTTQSLLTLAQWLRLQMTQR